MDEVELKIKDIFKVLKNRWKIIFGITIAITLFVSVMCFWVIKPVYEVNTKVFIGKAESQNSDYNNSDVVMYLNLLDTYSEIIKTNDLIKNAINEKNLDITPTEVMNDLEVTPKADTQILKITYQNQDKVLAKDVIEAVVGEFIKQSKELIKNGNITVVESAQLPERPVSPNKGRDIVGACFIGIIFGSIVALLLEYMDDTFKTKEQTENIIGIPVIGMIPCEDKVYSKSNKHTRKKNNELKVKETLYEN